MTREAKRTLPGWRRWLGKRRHQHRPTHPRWLERLRKARTMHGLRTAEMERMRKMIRDLKAGAKRLVELT